MSSRVLACDNSDCFLQNFELIILFLILGGVSVEEGRLVRVYSCWELKVNNPSIFYFLYFEITYIMGVKRRE